MPENFRLAETPLPALQDGQVLVRNLYISVDPYMRGRMNDVKSYSAPFAPGCGARRRRRRRGHRLQGRRTRRWGTSSCTSSAGASTPSLDAAATTPARTDLAPASAFLGALGMTGLTAYAGLLKVAEFKPGDAVFVSGAAGAVGSLVGQIAKARGASRVIGSAGTPEKVARLLELGFDAAFNYHDGPVRELLQQAAGTNGIDVYFDNVGGEHLEAALSVLNVGGRVAHVRRHLAVQRHRAPAAPRNLAAGDRQAADPRGFLVSGQRQHSRRIRRSRWRPGWPTARSATTRPWWTGWRMRRRPSLTCSTGANTGKMLVRI